MSDLDPAALVKLTSDVAAAYLAENHVPIAEIPALIASLHASFASLGRVPEPEVAPAKPIPPVPIRKTITVDHIISLEDGKPYRALKRHLTRLGLTPKQYRAKWGLPESYPMVAPAYAAAKSAQAKQIGLGLMHRKR